MIKLSNIFLVVAGVFAFAAGPTLHYSGISESWGYLQHGLTAALQVFGVICAHHGWTNLEARPDTETETVLVFPPVTGGA